MFLSNDDLLVPILCAALLASVALICCSFYLRSRKIQVETEIDEKKRELIREHLPHSQKKGEAVDVSNPSPETYCSNENPPHLQKEGEVVDVSNLNPETNCLPEGLQTLASPLSGQNDPAQIAHLGDSLCKVDEGCSYLLHFLQTLSSVQELNDNLLFYGALPITIAAVSSLGFSGGGHGSYNNSISEIKQRLRKVEQKQDGVATLHDRVDRVERNFIV